MVTAFSVAALSLARGRAERRISWVLELFIIAGSGSGELMADEAVSGCSDFAVDFQGGST
jgi:hypothetical protein